MIDKALSEEQKALSEEQKALSEEQRALSQEEQDKIEAAVFRRLLHHLDERKDVQNIDLMILSGFCRNCLSKWYTAAAEELGLESDYESSRTRVYGMPYSEWKDKHQPAATDEQIAAYKQANTKISAGRSDS